MKRLIALILCLCTLSGCLAGCKKNPAPAPAPKQEKVDDISGTWVAETDYGEIVKAAINQTGNEDLNNAMQLGEFKVKIQYTFKSDGTYQRKRLAEFSKEDEEALRAALKAGYIAFCTENEVDMESLSIDKVVSDRMNLVLGESGVFAGIDKEGQYKVEIGGKILFSTLPSSAADGNNYWSYTLKGDTLTLNSVTATPGEETIANFPLAFKKA